MAAATMHSLGRLDVLAMMDEKNNPYGKIPGEGGGGSGEIVKFPGSRAKTLDNAMNKMLNAPDAAAADRTKTLLRRVLGSDNVIPMSGK